MKKILIALFVLTQTIVTNAQFARSEVGLFGGVSYYLGDLNPSKHFLQSKPAGGIIYRYNLTPRWAFKFNGLYGYLEASDSKSKANERRNLSFKSQIIDLSAQIEFNFLPYITGHDKYYFSPYIFVGMALFNFNPQAEYDGKWYSLQALGTEGQGTTSESAKKPYSLTSLSIPFGLGVKASLFKVMSVGVEWGLRKTFTDYLDDVSTTYADPVILAAENAPISALLADRTIPGEGEVIHNTGLQRGNSNTKDWYSFTGVFISFRINAKSKICPAYKQHPRIKIKYSD